jgi:hypothetical protein
MTSLLIVKLRLERAMVLHGEILMRRDHCVAQAVTFWPRTKATGDAALSLFEARRVTVPSQLSQAFVHLAFWTVAAVLVPELRPIIRSLLHHNELSSN